MDSASQPLVSVPVVTYNSSKTVRETLDSIYDQTYQNLELIVSDDCSTDNTVDICREWIETHKGRFVRTELLTVEKNAGVSANVNRAETACQGEWIKGIAGDDRLLPNCIADCVDYVTQNQETVYLFGKVRAFGGDEERCEHYEKLFNGDFFKLSHEDQIRQLVFDGNMVPAVTCFYNRQKAETIGVKNDERIPLLEDWPKWINLLKAGIDLHFVDSYLVEYRLGGISTNHEMQSPAIHRSHRLFYYLYQFPDRYKEDPEKTIMEIINGEECKVYDWYYSVCHSWAYRVGRIVTKPFSWLKKVL